MASEMILIKRLHRLYITHFLRLCLLHMFLHGYRSLVTQILRVCNILPWLCALEDNQILQMLYYAGLTHDTIMAMVTAQIHLTCFVFTIPSGRYFWALLILCSLSKIFLCKGTPCNFKKREGHIWWSFPLTGKRCLHKQSLCMFCYSHWKSAPVPQAAFLL